MQFPFLSLLIFTPLAAAVAILFLPADKKSLIKGISLGGASLVLGLSVYLFAAYDLAAGGYQFQERVPWLPQLGISYHVGLDGISLPLVLMAGLVVFSGVLVSWRVNERPREFFAFFMFLAASVFGVFASLDLFQLFFFFELAVFP
ncbi:MAG: NADH-quinone oxidoreductase subunit M, partial [Anaerolineaceae bacterium]|nr:NADH-quinone oxidoreductase subunit M [Anaerolineaceae bacterium]